MQEFINQGRLAGMTTMLARHGKIVHFEAYGARDREAGRAMPPDAIFRIYSMTKPIIGVGLMTLYEEGKFQLSDPVAMYIPEFADLEVAAGVGVSGPLVEAADHPMTIRELMTHTAGLTYGIFSNSQVDALYRDVDMLDRSGTLSDMIAKLAHIPLWGQPGDQWHYSVAVDVQGYLIEVLSGEPLFDPKEDLAFVGMIQQFGDRPDVRGASRQYVYDAITVRAN
jgi:CubicO group peptidase (beta-lactamase class C family)